LRPVGPENKADEPDSTGDRKNNIAVRSLQEIPQHNQPARPNWREGEVNIRGAINDSAGEDDDANPSRSRFDSEQPFPLRVHLPRFYWNSRTK
jgi:hypothetical protein